MDVAIYLARNAIDCRVIVGGVEVTEACVGVALRAFAGEMTRVTLHLSTSVQLSGEVDRVEIQQPPQEGTEGP
jgi:hypothetical protein